MKIRHIVFDIILFSINLTAQHKNFIGFGVVSEMNRTEINFHEIHACEF